MAAKLWSSVALLALLNTGCTAAVPSAAPPAAAEAAPQIVAISDADLAALTDEQFAALSDLQIAALSKDQIASLSASRLAAMTPSQRATLILMQFSTLTLPQVKALPPALFAAMTPAQIRSISAVQAQAMTPAQLAALSPEQAAAAAAASADTTEAAGPDKGMPLPLVPGPPVVPGAVPAAPAPVQPGLYVQVMDGLISQSNPSGAPIFNAGQFGFVPNLQMPPIVVPQNPGLKFTPPPAFSSATNPPSTTSPKSNSTDCIVRYGALQQAAPVLPAGSATIGVIPQPTPGSTIKTSSPDSSKDKDDASPVKQDSPNKVYCN